ncbi:17340_t:CDS:1, partial [Acaulospora morrowiae]
GEEKLELADEVVLVVVFKCIWMLGVRILFDELRFRLFVIIWLLNIWINKE